MRLFLCEKPSQAKSLANVVGARSRGEGHWSGDGVVVSYAIGHLLQQAMPEDYDIKYKSWSLDILPCVPQTWKMSPSERTIDQYKVVKKLIKQADDIVIATDADREGEVIARELLDDAGYRGRLSRLWVSDSTDAGIRKGLSKLHPGEEHAMLYQAGLGRMRADWLAGMNLTRGLSAFSSDGPLRFGRVQTPTLTLVVRRERAIANFKPAPYFTVAAAFAMGEPQALVRMRWLATKDRLDADGRLVDPAIAKAVVAAVNGQTGRNETIKRTSEKTPAPLLYYLGSLQKECSARFGLSPNKTLEIAQALYQDHKLTTYPRTDCEYISEEMHAEAPGVIGQLKRVEAYAPLAAGLNPGLRGRAFNTAKVAASAHHAIVPTTNPEVAAIAGALDGTTRKVFDLIVKRYLAQFMGDYLYERTAVLVSCAGERFEAVGNVPTQLGWKRAYADEADSAKAKATAKSKSKDKEGDDEDGADDNIQLPPLTQGAAANNRSCEAIAKKTTPPKRYTEGTLLAAMESIDKEVDDPRLAAILRTKEKAGIGTDATRGDIIAKLFKNEYLATEKKFITPTERGSSLVALMEKECPALVDLALTAVWEDKLNEVAQGKLTLDAFEKLIARFVDVQIERLRKTAPTSRPRGAANGGAGGAPVELAGSCPVCAKPMAKRSGAKGVFWGCTGYPDCKTTLPDQDGKPGQRTSPAQAPSTPGKIGASCPTCSKGKLTQKATSQGKPFIGCTQFPECRHFQWINL